MPKQFVVTATIQSNNIDGNEPVEVNYYRGNNGMVALSALSQAAANYEDIDPNVPKMYQIRTLSVRMDITDLVDTEPEVSGNPADEQAEPYASEDRAERASTSTTYRVGDYDPTPDLVENYCNAEYDGDIPAVCTWRAESDDWPHPSHHVAGDGERIVAVWAVK